MATQPPPPSVFQIRIPGGQNSPMFSSAGCSFLGLKAVLWIRIREGKNNKNRKKFSKNFKNAGCSFLRAECFSCSLDVLYGGRKISKLPFDIKKRYKK
jgi:hypothetical protein